MWNRQMTGALTNASGPLATQRSFTITRPFFTLFGRSFRVTDERGELVYFVRHKVLSLKDEWSIFADEAMQVPLVRVKARQFVSLNVETDFTDAQTGARIGTVRNRGLRSIFRDTWDVLDGADQPVGVVTEDSNALLRRLIPLLLGHWHIEIAGRPAARLDQRFRFFIKEFHLTVEPQTVDPRFAVGCACLALLREIHRDR